MASSDLQMQFDEQQKLVEHLKSLIQQKDEDFQKKEKELQETNAKLSKMKLQAKAKVVKMTSQLEETKRGVTEAAEKVSELDLRGEQTNRAKIKMMKRKLEEKDRVLFENEQQIEARDKVLNEKEDIIKRLRLQLEERDKFIMDIGQSEKTETLNKSAFEDKINHIYAQIVYKDKMIVDLNNKILEQDRKVIDLQEFVGEKNEVIRGRDKVVEVLQGAIQEKEQSIQSQNTLITKLTSKVETSEERLGLLAEKLQKAEHDLKVESEKFNLKLTETQKYFEETLQDKESEITRLRETVQMQEKDIKVRDGDLRELISRHEKDLERIMSKEGSLQDKVVQMLEQKLKDINEVLEGKIQVIEVLQKEVSEKDKQMENMSNSVKSLKEKLQVNSEQTLLMQQSFVDLEHHWKDERAQLENQLSVIVEKHESEKNEKEVVIQTLQVSLKQYEDAYAQAAMHYSTLQERYQQVAMELEVIRGSAEQTLAEDGTSIAQLQDSVKHLEKQLSDREDTIRVLKCLLEEAENKSETKLLKMKAQLTSKVKSLQNQNEKLKKGSELAQEVVSLKNQLAEVEDEKGNLQLHLVDYDETKALQDELEKQLKDVNLQKDSLTQTVADLTLQLKEIEEEKDKVSLTVVELQQVIKQNQIASDQEKEQEVKKFESDLKDLQMSISQLETEKKQCMDRQLMLEIKCTQAEEENSQLQSIQEELHTQIKASDSAITELQRNLVERSETSDRLEGEKVGLEIRAAELEEQKEVLEKENLGIFEEIAKLKSMTESESQPSIALEMENTRLLTKMEVLLQELSTEKILAKDQKEEIQQFTAKIEHLETEKKSLEKEQFQHAEELNRVYQLKVENEDELERLRFDLTEKEQVEENLSKAFKEQAELEKQLQVKEAEIESFCKNINHEDTSLLNHQVVLNEKLVNFEEVQSKLQAQEEELSKTHDQLSQTTGELNSLRAQHQEEVDKITAAVESYRKDCDLYKEMVNQRDQIIKSLQENKERDDSEVTNLKASLKSKEEVMSVLEFQLNQLEREASLLKQNKMEKGEEFDSKVCSLLNQITDLENELIHQQLNVNKMEQLMEKLQAELKTKSEQLAEIQEEHEQVVSELQVSAEAKDQQLAELKKVHAELEQEHKIQISNSRQELETAKKEIIKNQTELEKVKNELSEKDLKVETIAQRFEDMSQVITARDELICDLQIDKEAAQKETEKLKTGISLSIASLKDMHQKFDIFEADAGSDISLNDNVNFLCAQLESYRLQVEDLLSQVNDSSGKHEMLVKQISELELSLAKRDEDMAKLKDALEEYKTQLENISKDSGEEIEMLRKKLQESEIQNEKYLAEVNTVKLLLDTLKETAAARETALLAADSNIQQLTNDLEQVKQKYTALESESAVFQESKEDLEVVLLQSNEKVRSLSDNLKFLLLEKEALHANLTQKEGELLFVSQENHSLEINVANFKTLCKKHEAQIQDLCNKMEEKSSEKNKQISEAFNMLRLEKQEEEKQVLSFLARVQESDDKYIELNCRYTELLRERDNLARIIKEFEGSFSDKDIAIGDLLNQQKVLNTEIKRSVDICKNAESRVEALLGEKDNLKNKLEVLNKLLEEKNFHIASLEDKLTEVINNWDNYRVEKEGDICLFKEVKEKLTMQLTILQDEKVDLNEKYEGGIRLQKALLQEKDMHIKNLSSAIEDCCQQNKLFEREVGFLKSEKQELEKKVKDLHISLRGKDELERQLLDLKISMEEMLNEKTLIFKSINSLESCVCNWRKLLGIAESATLEGETGSGGYVASDANHFDIFVKKFTDLEGVLLHLKNDKDELERKVSSLENCSFEKDIELRVFREEMKEKIKKKESDAVMVEALKEEISCIYSESENFRAKSLELSEAYITKEKELAVLQESSKKLISQFEEILEEKEDELEAKRVEVIALEADKEKLQCEKDGLHLQVQDVINFLLQLEDCSPQLDSYKDISECLKVLRDGIASLWQRISVLKKETSMLKQELAKSENSNDEIKNEFNEIASVVCEITSKFEKLGLKSIASEGLLLDAVKQLGKFFHKLVEWQVTLQKEVGSLNGVVRAKSSEITQLMNHMEEGAVLQEELSKENEKLKQKVELSDKEKENGKRECEIQVKQFCVEMLEISTKNAQTMDENKLLKIEIEKLTRELLEKKICITELMKDCDTVFTEKQSLESSLREVESKISTLTREKEYLSQVVSEKETEVLSSQKTCSILKEEMDEKNKQIETLNEKISFLMMECSDNTNKMESAAFELKCLLQNTEHLKEEAEDKLASTLMELKESEKCLHESKREISTLSKNHSLLMERVAGMLRDMDDLKRCLDQVECKQSQTLQEKDELLLELAGCKELHLKQTGEFENSLKTMEENIKEKTWEIAVLQETLRRKQVPVENYSTEVRRLGKSVEKIEKLTFAFEEQEGHCQGIKQLLNEERKKYSDLLLTFTEIENEKENLVTDHKKLCESLWQKEHEMKDLIIHLKGRESETSKLADKIVELEEVVSSKNSEVDFLQETENVLNIQLKEMKLQLDEAAAELVMTKTSLCEETEKFNKLSRMLEDERAEIDRLNHDVGEMKSELSDCIDERNHMKAQLNNAHRICDTKAQMVVKLEESVKNFVKETESKELENIYLKESRTVLEDQFQNICQKVMEIERELLMTKNNFSMMACSSNSKKVVNWLEVFKSELVNVRNTLSTASEERDQLVNNDSRLSELVKLHIQQVKELKSEIVKLSNKENNLNAHLAETIKKSEEKTYWIMELEKMVAEFKECVSAKDREMGFLKQIENSLKGKIEMMQFEASAYEAELTEERKKLIEIQCKLLENVKQKELEISQYDVKLLEVKTELSKLSDENSKLVHRNQAMGGVCEDKNKQFEELKDSVAKMEEMLLTKDLKGEEILGRKLQKVPSRFEEVKSELKYTKKDFCYTTDERNKPFQKYAQLMESLKKKELEVDKIYGHIVEGNFDESRLVCENKQFIPEIEKAGQISQSKCLQIRRLKETLALFEEMAAEKDFQIISLKEVEAKMTVKLESTQSYVEDLQLEISNTKDCVLSLHKEIAKKDSTILHLMANLKDKNDQLMTILDALRAIAKKLPWKQNEDINENSSTEPKNGSKSQFAGEDGQGSDIMEKFDFFLALKLLRWLNHFSKESMNYEQKQQEKPLIIASHLDSMLDSNEETFQELSNKFRTLTADKQLLLDHRNTQKNSSEVSLDKTEPLNTPVEIQQGNVAALQDEVNQIFAVLQELYSLCQHCDWMSVEFSNNSCEMSIIEDAKCLRQHLETLLQAFIEKENSDLDKARTTKGLKDGIKQLLHNHCRVMTLVPEKQKQREEIALHSLEYQDMKVTNIYKLVEELQEMLSTRDKHVSSLREQVEQLSSKNQEYLQNLNQLKHEYNVLHETLENKNESLAEHEAVIVSFKELADQNRAELQRWCLEVDSLQSQLSIANTNIEHLKRASSDSEVQQLEMFNQDIEMKQAQLEESQNLAEELKEKLKKKEEKVSSLLENMQELEERVEGLTLAREEQDLRSKAEIEMITNSLQEKESALAAARCEFDEKELMFKKVYATAKKLKFQLQEVSKEKTELEENLSELQEKFDEQQSALNEALEKASELKTENASLVANQMVSSQEKDTKLEELNIQVQSYAEYAEQVQEQKEKLIQLHQDKLDSLNSIQQENERLSLELLKKQRLIIELQERLEAVEEKGDGLNAELANKNEKVMDLERSVNEKTRVLEETLLQHDAVIKESSMLSNENIEVLKRELEEKEKVLMEFGKKYASTQEALASVIDEKNHYNEELEDMNKLLLESKMTCDKLTAQIILLTGEVKAKSERVDVLEVALETAEEKLMLLEKELLVKNREFEDIASNLVAAKDENLMSKEKVADLLETLKKESDNMEKFHLKTQLEKETVKMEFESILQEKSEMIEIQRETIEMLQKQKAVEPTGNVLDIESEHSTNQWESLKLQLEAVLSEKELLSGVNCELQGQLDEAALEREKMKTESESQKELIERLQESLLINQNNIKGLEEEIIILSEKITKKQMDLEDHESSNNELESKMADLEAKAEDLSRSCQVLESENAKLKADVEELRKPVSENQEREWRGVREERRLEEERLRVSSSVDLASVDGSQVELMKLKEIHGSLLLEHECAKGKLQVSEAKCEKMLVKLKAFKDKNCNLQNELQGATRQVATMKEERGNSVEELIDLKKTVSLLTDRIATEGEKYLGLFAAYQSEQEDSKLAKERFNKMEANLKYQLQELDSSYKLALQEKETSVQEIKHLKMQYEEETLVQCQKNEGFRSTVKKLESQVENLKLSILSANRDLKAIAEDILNWFSTESATLMNKIVNLETQYRIVNADNADYQKLVGELHEKQNIMNQENGRLQHLIESLQKDLAFSEKQGTSMDALEQQFESVEEERDSLKDQIEAVRDEILVARNEKNILAERLDGKVQEAASSKKEVLELNMKIQKLENDKEILAKKIGENNQLREEVVHWKDRAHKLSDTKEELLALQKEIMNKDETIVLCKKEFDNLTLKLKEYNLVSESLENALHDCSVLRTDNATMNKHMKQSESKLESLAGVKSEFESLSDRYSSLLNDNNDMAKQIEDLHARLQQISVLEKDLSFARDQLGHIEREKFTLNKRVVELESQCQELAELSTCLKQELAETKSGFKQLNFENTSVKSQLQVLQSGGDRLLKFQAEYDKLQQQFSKSIEHNNQVQAELNQALHRLQQRESRCQQLAIQVSQLAEDRSYLNTQLGNLSKALHEKENEASSTILQYKSLYNDNTALKVKINELEQNHVEEGVQRAGQEFVQMSESTDSQEKELRKCVHDLEQQNEELMQKYSQQEHHLAAEQEKRLKVEAEFFQAQQKLKVLEEQQASTNFQIQIDEAADPKIIEAYPMLIRQGRGYCQRLHRWIKVKREYLCFSSRQFSRLMRIQPGIRSMIWIYFILLHIVVLTAFLGYL